LEQELDEYFSLRGWSADGLPTMEKLKELQIEDLGEKLKLKLM
jgi:aldehyde:ferredoxin oxidoreductase